MDWFVPPSWYTGTVFCLLLFHPELKNQAEDGWVSGVLDEDVMAGVDVDEDELGHEDGERNDDKGVLVIVSYMCVSESVYAFFFRPLCYFFSFPYLALPNLTEILPYLTFG